MINEKMLELLCLKAVLKDYNSPIKRYKPEEQDLIWNMHCRCKKLQQEFTNQYLDDNTLKRV